MTAEKFGEKYGIWIVGAIIAIFTCKHFFGTTVPGSFFERSSDYSAKMYVLLFPDGSTSKNYRVPADIDKGESGYSVTRIYWSNGGTLDFSSCSALSLTHAEWCSPDGEDTDYKVQLTNDVVR